MEKKDFADAAYSLEARIGKSRGRSSCGSTRNVIYTVETGGERALVVKARGKTGNCEPNVLDQLGRTAASYR